jgi:hypothetical protein
MAFTQSWMGKPGQDARFKENTIKMPHLENEEQVT